MVNHSVVSQRFGLLHEAGVACAWSAVGVQNHFVAVSSTPKQFGEQESVGPPKLCPQTISVWLL